MGEEPPQAGALDGIVVADFSRVLAGPFATMLLGDLGADVIKVERPGTGDDSRAWGPPFVEGESAYYLAANRNKRSLALDLSLKKDLEVARRLAERADVLVENFKTGTMGRLGLGYDDLAGANPALVYCSISGFGTTGPGASMLGYDYLVQALGGLMSITGEAGGTPMKVGVAVVDVLTGMFASNAILAALHARSVSGKGQLVEVSLFSSLLAGLVNQASTFVTTGVVPHALGNRHPSVCPYELFETADRPIVVAVGNDRQFAAMAGVVGEGWMAGDGRFARNSARVEHRQELARILGEALSKAPAGVWLDRFDRVGVPAGPVNDIAEAFALAEQLGHAPVVSVGPPGDEVAQVADPMRLAGTPVRYRRRPPRLGEHTEEVIAELSRDAR